MRVVIATFGVTLCAATALLAAAPRKKANSPEQQVKEFCREQATTRLKYVKTIDWLDAAREKEPGVWIVSGVRTAKASSGNVDQQYTCRVSLAQGVPRLRMLQLFKESTKSGKDVFELY